MRMPAPPTPSIDNATPLDVLWQAPVLVWIVLAGEGVAAVLALAPGKMEIGRLAQFGLASLIVQWIAMLTVGGLYLLRRVLARLQPLRIVAVALALLVFSAWLVSGASWLLLHDSALNSSTWALLAWRFVGIAAIVGLLGLAAIWNHWRTRAFALRTKQAELESLQARIRPHFLFNTLNSGIALVRQQPAQAEDLLFALSDLFRAALAQPHNVLLGEELDLARRYLQIESVRFGKRLQVEWELPEPLPAIAIPALSVQPLVENAIRHGVEPSPQGATIEIAVESDAHAVRVHVRNPVPDKNAPGARGNETRGHQVGLNSVRARTQALTLGRGEVLTREENGVFVATIVLPL